MGAPLSHYIRGAVFMTVFLIAAMTITLVNVPVFVFCLLFDRQFYWTAYVTTSIARFVAWLFFKVTVVGRLPTPAEAPAVVLVSNHQSTLDTVITSSMNYFNFKVTYKQELLYMPGVGSSFWLSGYLAVKRGDKSSGRAMLEAAAKYLHNGVSLFFFPEGTRKIEGTGGPLGEFKPGAFKLAIDNGVPVVPLTISGARAMMPARGYPTLAPGDAVLTIHPPISSVGKTVEQLSEEVRAVIISGLRPIDYIFPASRSSRETPAEDKKAQ